MMVLSDFETMEHLLDVGCDGYGFLMKSKKDSQQVIVQIRARQQDVVEGDAMMLGTRVDKLFFHLWFLFKGTLQRIESIKSLSPRWPSGPDHGNQMSPLHNLTLLQPRFKLLILSGQRRMTLFRHTISPSKYCKADVKPPSFISSWYKAALTQFALLKRNLHLIILFYSIFILSI